MAINLQTLIKVAPFSQDVREKLLPIVDKLSEDQKLRLSQTAWLTLSQLYHGEVLAAYDRILLEIEEGKRSYNRNDFAEAEAKLLYEMSQKFDSATSEKTLSEVREKLQQYAKLTPPPPTTSKTQKISP